MSIILGIDPGSKRTGYGLINVQGKQIHYITSGCIKLPSAMLSQTLSELFKELQSIIQEYKPQEVAVEEVFFYRNPHSALVLGQARGIALATAGLSDLPVSHYAARQIKQVVTGYGAANKPQIQQMMQRLLRLNQTPSPDAADALAIAWCHAQCRIGVARIALQEHANFSGNLRRGRLQ